MFTTFELTQEITAQDTAELRPHGELDIASAPEFRRTAAGLIGSGCRHMMVDLSDTEFLDSSGLGALIWVAQRLNAVGGDFAVSHPHDDVLRTLRVAHLDEFFDVV